MKNKSWTKEETEYLSENWGTVGIDYMAKKFNRTKTAIIVRVQRLGLGRFLENGEYITAADLAETLGYDFAILKSWIKKGLPVRNKKVRNNYFKVINIEEFWEWASKNRTMINFSKVDSCYLGIPPEWVKEKRIADKEHFSFFKMTPWSQTEEKDLMYLVNQYKFSYYEISQRLKRTEGAIKRRLIELGIKARPVRKDNHTPWTNAEVEKLIFYFNKGYSSDIISIKMNGVRSAQSCRGKIERLIKENQLLPRSEFKKSC